MSKCLGLPPPLMYFHPQSLLSGSEPQMPHCFWKPPGKKGTEETPACPWHRKVPEVTPTCPGILYQHPPPWDCQVCYSPRACVKSPRCLKGLIGPSHRALLPRRQAGSTGQASWETLSGSSSHGTCIFHPLGLSCRKSGQIPTNFLLEKCNSCPNVIFKYVKRNNLHKYRINVSDFYTSKRK